MNLEAVTTSVGYADFLAHSLLFNKRHFDRLVVVTDSADQATRNICAYHHVQCVTTDLFYENDHAFNKGKGINAGLAVLGLADFVVHLDADVILPPRTKELLSNLNLSPAKLYGIDRIMCGGFADWLRHVQSPELQHSGEAFVKATSFPLGSRLVWTNEQGYLPIGFFQMWNPKGSGVRTYPINHGEAARADCQFALAWPRSRRELLPEIVAIHLESQSTTQGLNWRGRRAREFSLEGAALPEGKPGFIYDDGYKGGET